MEGDSRNPKVSLVKKYDIPIENISYEYVENCSDIKELEKIVRILRSGQEGFYPDLLKATQDRLRIFAPDSRVLRIETPVLTKEALSSEEWKRVENDLFSWEEEMRVIDKSLDFEKSRIDVVGNKNMPNVRKITESNLISKPIKITQKEFKYQRDDKNERIKSGDYAAWDKFDVDKELLKMDVEEERKEEENAKKKRVIKKLESEKKIELGNINKDSLSPTEQLMFAHRAKDLGNESFKSGDLTLALKYYDLSIQLYATANAFNNRAMTYLKLLQYENAINDCNVVLSMEKNNIKALHRRSVAYQQIANDTNNFNMLALKDLNSIVQLEPNNKLAQVDLQKLKKKLGIEDIGKKFRMPICETNSERNPEVKVSDIKNKEKKISTSGFRDNSINVEKLPLTYYGPSTSTFQCEPYSMAHRALSGSLLSTEIMCKCNSSRPRQNPLCQKCGEAMCTPKMLSKPTLSNTSNKKDMSTKTINEAKNILQKLEGNKVEHKNVTEKINSISSVREKEVPKTNKEICNKIATNLGDNNNGESFAMAKKECSEEEKNDKISEVLTLASTVENKKSNVTGEVKPIINKREIVEVDKCVLTINDMVLNDSEQANKRKTERISPDNTVLPDGNTKQEHAKSFSGENLASSSTKNKMSESCICDGSSQSQIKHSSSKSKTKKKKSKERCERHARKPFELSEHLKVVHADKYIHPTSVEPKVKTESSKKFQAENNNTGTNQFKAFVPNRQCLSAHREETKNGNYLNSMIRKISTNVESCKNTPEEVHNTLSYEGNKENYLANTKSLNIKESQEIQQSSRGDTKKIVLNSAFEFTKSWEEVKKSDPSYVKRAEIIRLIRPDDLGKVIGIKLDSDMLSSLLECLEKHFVESDPKIVVEFLKQLPQIPRFGLIKMFLVESDKKIIKNLIAAAESKGFTLDENIKKALAVTS